MLSGVFPGNLESCGDGSDNSCWPGLWGERLVPGHAVWTLLRAIASRKRSQPVPARELGLSWHMVSIVPFRSHSGNSWVANNLERA